MKEDVEVKTVTKGVKVGFTKSINRINRLITKNPKKRSLIRRLEKIGKCNYCSRPFQLGEQFIQVGHNKYHLECYNKAFLDVPDDFSQEEQCFIETGTFISTIPIYSTIDTNNKSRY
ncbi:MAG: hypothetical protein QXW80_06825 [Candidatus Micrarchaeia archaeon]